MGSENLEVYDVDRSTEFIGEAKRLIRKKKFFTLPKQIDELVADLKQGKLEGDRIKHSETPTPYDVYKLRLPNLDANVGKSNGYRVIYFVVTDEKVIVLLTMYYKKEQEDVTDTYIDGLIDGYFLSRIPLDDADDV